MTKRIKDGFAGFEVAEDFTYWVDKSMVKDRRKLALSLNDARLWTGRSLKNRHVDQELDPFGKRFHHCMNGLSKMRIWLFKKTFSAKPQGGAEILLFPCWLFLLCIARTLVTSIPTSPAFGCDADPSLSSPPGCDQVLQASSV